MEIVPAIEIKNGQSIWQTHPRAAQPNLKVTDPLRIAARWKEEGATRIHLVDVDGARVGMPQNREVIRDLIRRTALPVQLSGGIPTADVADRMYTIGVDRIIIPLKSVPASELAEMLRRQPDKVVVAIQVLDGRWVAGNRPGAEMPIKAVVTSLKTMGLRRVMFNAVDKADYPILMHLDLLAQLTALPVLKVIMGSVSTPQEVNAYAGVGVETVILGKALYENKIGLSGKQ